MCPTGSFLMGKIAASKEAFRIICERSGQPRTRRVCWIDTLRAIAIVFVVIGHTPGIQGYHNIVKYIYSFHIPLFFFLSGLVFDAKLNEGFYSFFRNDARRLLIPYFTWGFLTYVPWVVIARHYGSYPNLNPLKPLLGMLYGTGSGTWMLHNGALWFLPCLFVARLIFFATIALAPRSYYLLAWSIFTILGFVCSQTVPFPLPWGLDIALIAIGFLGTGFHLKDRLLSTGSISTPSAYLVGILGVLGVTHIIVASHNARISFTEGAFGNVFFFLSGALIGIAFWLIIATIIPASPAISMIGESTMLIFVLHTFVFNQITGFGVFILRLPPMFKYESLLSTVIYTSIAVASTVALMQIIRRFQPWLVGR